MIILYTCLNDSRQTVPQRLANICWEIASGTFKRHWSASILDHFFDVILLLHVSEGQTQPLYCIYQLQLDFGLINYKSCTVNAMDMCDHIDSVYRAIGMNKRWIGLQELDHVATNWILEHGHNLFDELPKNIIGNIKNIHSNDQTRRRRCLLSFLRRLAKHKHSAIVARRYQKRVGDKCKSFYEYKLLQW